MKIKLYVDLPKETFSKDDYTCLDQALCNFISAYFIAMKTTVSFFELALPILRRFVDWNYVNVVSEFEPQVIVNTIQQFDRLSEEKFTAHVFVSTFPNDLMTRINEALNANGYRAKRIYYQLCSNSTAKELAVQWNAIFQTFPRDVNSDELSIYKHFHLRDPKNHLKDNIIRLPAIFEDNEEQQQ